MSVHGRQSLTLRDKVDIINAVNNGAKRKEILEQYQLPPSTLSSLLRHKDQLLKKMRERKVSPSSKRIRSVDSAELEEEMKAFVSDCRRDDVALTGGLMLSKAKEIALKLGLSNFRASRGWLYNFKKRHGISPGKNNILFNLLNSDQIVKVNLCSEDSAWSNITKEKEHAEGTVNLNQDIHKPMDNEYLVAANPPLHFERAALKVEALDDTNEDFQHDQNNENAKYLCDCKDTEESPKVHLKAKYLCDCKDTEESPKVHLKQAEWSGLDQPSCSSLADSEQLLTEDQQQLEPETMLVEIKEEIPWEDQNCTRAMEPAQEDVQRIPVELMRGEDPVTAALQRMRGEMSELARADQLSAGLNQLRADIGTLARGDEFDAFGRYVASLLRNMRPRRAQHAQPVIINLLAAEMIKKDDDET